ncbi:hypothetical protein [Streptomyces sp. NPDC046161]|uniref:hypothetical protein n=1 Tax=Streptomyces sp. NPDC046161 TaxID=3155132 RepID=UPI0033F94316
MTLLRPDAFAGNALGWAHFIARGLPVPLAYPDACIAPVHPADIAVRALTGDRLAGRALTLTGAQSLTFREQLAIIADTIGRPVAVAEITREEAEEQLARHMPPAMAGSLLDLWARATVTPVPIADTTASLLAAEPRTFAEWVRENAAAFTAR